MNGIPSVNRMGGNNLEFVQMTCSRSQSLRLSTLKLFSANK